ncbi:MAG TPA: ATP-grasp domain-containing protein [Modicisalibacter sp.]|nr:ATP-grasp domain-containing protein [Modicisalibacter sp.]
MNFEEHASKEVLRKADVAVPDGRLCSTAQEAREAAQAIGPCVVKAQVPTGKRGKAGGIRPAADAATAGEAAEAILGMRIEGHEVKRVLAETQADIERELYAAVLNDADSRSPLVLFSSEGGMDIEEIAAERPDSLRRHVVAIEEGFSLADAERLIGDANLGTASKAVARLICGLYQVYRTHDAELVEVNPLAVLRSGQALALDCKLTLDDAALDRQKDLAVMGAPEHMTELERRGQELGLKYIELEGSVGVLANGAGLTMTTMDVIDYFGGRPANFLEIGGQAYTQATPALELVLSNPRVKSLVINFCGAFARTDVMAEGVIEAWEKLQPKAPGFFSIHGTGEEEAVALVRERLGVEPFDRMEDAVRAAVEAAS